MNRSRYIALAALPLALVATPPVRAQPAAEVPAVAATQAMTAADAGAAVVDRSAGKPRVLVLTDIGNEPDDQMSMVRLLAYSNALDIEGLIATTSTWLKDKVQPETIHTLIADYAQVRPNLMLHAKDWPQASALDALVGAGPAKYGMAGIDAANPSDGARRLIAAADRADARPLHIAVWGGANTLAEALSYVRATRTPAQLAAFVARLRVSSISDQDDAGPWIRREFPGLFYVVKPSPPDGAEYASATWTGISGDKFYRNGDGADFTTVTNEWLDQHIRKGPFGAHYPKFLFIMEGDTPSYLSLLPNGLESWRSPGWGGWGGRYVYRQPYGETHPIWTQGGDVSSRVTSADTVTGADGRTYTTDQATIWRWREAYQNDFAARMAWSYLPYNQANHHPVAAIAGQEDDGVIELNAKVGQPIALDASGSHDPDGDRLSFKWFRYAEAGAGSGPLATLDLKDAANAKVTVTATDTCSPGWLPSTRPCPAQGSAHLILAVTDSGSPALTRYRRVILHVSR
jgi:hypothetical protein